jgi:hypothetical protein
MLNFNFKFNSGKTLSIVRLGETTFAAFHTFKALLPNILIFSEQNKNINAENHWDKGL